MRCDRRPSAAALIATLTVFALLSACAMQPRSGTSARADSATTSPAIPVARTTDSVSALPAAEVEDHAPETGNAIAAILADRRRSDYPDIELWESGFTITEQVRIGGQARADYERALSLLSQERYNEGIAVLRQVTAAVPDATAPYIDLGIAYGQIGDLDQAEQAFDTAALLSPDNPIVQNELGILYRKTGRFAEARISYETALAVFRGFHFARRNLAILCDLYLADLECALENYQAYLASVGSDSQVEIWIADVENRLGN